MRKRLVWSSEKNAELQRVRGFGFEEIAQLIRNDKLLADIENPSLNYPNQRVYVIEIDGYAVAVPYFVGTETIFLKTAFRNRRLKRRHLES